MSDENLYAAPQVELEAPQEKGGPILASRSSRLGAAVIDGFVYMAFFLPVMLAVGFEKLANPEWASSPTTKILLALISLPGFAINWYFVKQSGQTLGKKALKIRMVRTDGSILEPKRWFLARVLPIYLVSQLPIVGPWISIANIVFVFRKDRLCLHDRIAGTMVVEA